MIKDLVKVWDGLVEITLDGGVMNIRHVPPLEDPEPVSHKNITVDEKSGNTIVDYNTQYKVNIMQEPCLWASEGVNIVHDSVNLTDWNPKAINHLIVHYTTDEGINKSISFSDDVLIERFGEQIKETDAFWYKHETSTEEQTSTNTDTEIPTSNSETKETSITDLETPSTNTQETTKTNTIKVPITTYEEAMLFGLGEWFKLQRDNGFKLEFKVIGSNKWRCGRWCKIYLHSLHNYMNAYINRANHEYNGGEWITSIECYPAPACIKEDDSKEETEKNNEEATNTEEDTSNPEESET